MQIGASAALPWNFSSSSADEWIPVTSRADAAPAPDFTSSTEIVAAWSAGAADSTGFVALASAGASTGLGRLIGADWA